MTEPRGATVVVWRRAPSGIEFLLLHRAAHPTDFHGDWAWTPPAGARAAHESLEDCARRELLEETGLKLEPRPTACGDDVWSVYEAELRDDEIRLDSEHDRYEWLGAAEASARCLPTRVGDQIGCVAIALSQPDE